MSFLNTLSTTEILQLISIIITAFISITSICISLSTLKQTNKITEKANRPYVVIYYEIINVTSVNNTYLVIKNFGNTGAVIDSVNYSPEFKNNYPGKPFSNLSNHFIAPKQSFTDACSFGTPYQPITFTIKYHQGKTIYTESFIINPEAALKNLIAKSAPNDSTNLEKLLAYSTQEILRKNL